MLSRIIFTQSGFLSIFPSGDHEAIIKLDIVAFQNNQYIFVPYAALFLIGIDSIWYQLSQGKTSYLFLDWLSALCEELRIKRALNWLFSPNLHGWTC